MATIKFVYFDVGGVLLNWKNAMRLLAVEIDRPLEEVFEVFKKYDDEACRGAISPTKLLQLYKQDLAVAIDIDDYEINANAAKELGWQTVLFDEENLEDSVSRIQKALRLNLTT